MLPRQRVALVVVGAVGALGLLVAAFLGFVAGAQVGVDDSVRGRQEVAWLVLWAVSTLVPLIAAVAVAACAVGRWGRFGKRLALQFLLLTVAVLACGGSIRLLAGIP
ncbi:hypothetical protein ACGF0J_11145 [Nonomuraea sp. NPDC047897]|uniref:hypothetical protein n=1 Tax=Nonomuraea sp. NPDC047897 TaxID=3364346 RepID=UPI0037146445